MYSSESSSSFRGGPAKNWMPIEPTLSCTCGRPDTQSQVITPAHSSISTHRQQHNPELLYVIETAGNEVNTEQLRRT